jgi:DNA polymerase I
MNLNPRIIIDEIPPLALPNDRVAIDSEWFGMERSKLHRPITGRFASMQITYDGQTVYVCTKPKLVAQYFEAMEPAIWIFHNAFFDITQLRRHATILPRKRVYDTMLVEQIMYSGFYNGTFSLKDLARRYLGVVLKKDTREDFTTENELTDETILYGALDAIATWEVYWKQKEILDEKSEWIWRQVEKPFLWTLLNMKGIKLDVEKWNALADANKEDADKRKSEYDFNIASPKQLKERFAKMGVGIESTGEKVLAPLASGAADESTKLAKDVLDYRKVAKRASTYGRKITEEVIEADGRMWAQYNQVGAETARLSCSRFQQIPHDKSYRECFIAEDGYKLVIADWSSQEPRIMAHLSQDQKLIEILSSGQDLYTLVAWEVLEKRITKDSSDRKDMKAVILGLNYGMSKYGLANKLQENWLESKPEAENERWGWSKQDWIDYAEYLIDKFFEVFPGVAAYIARQRRAKEYVQSVYGRKVWLNKYTTQWERNAMNAPIQSSAGDALKIAGYRIQELFGDRQVIVGFIHDEIILEVPEDEAEQAKADLQRVMIETAEEMHPGIPAAIEIFVADNWSEKH